MTISLVAQRITSLQRCFGLSYLDRYERYEELAILSADAEYACSFLISDSISFFLDMLDRK